MIAKSVMHVVTRNISPNKARAGRVEIRRGMRVAILVCAFASIFATASVAQSPDINCKTAYDNARFDAAITSCSDAAAAPGVGGESRAKALLLLARSHVAKNETSNASQALASLLDLGAAAPVLDPDIESPPLMRLYYDEQKRRLGSYRIGEEDSTLINMAIIDFTNGSVGAAAAGYDAWRTGLASLLINYLNGATSVAVVERERLSWLVDELDLQRDNRYVDFDSAVKMGRLLGAHVVVIGNFIVTRKEELLVGARLVSVETGRVLIGNEKKGKLDDFDSLLQELSADLARLINAEINKATLRKLSETKSIDAMRAYSEGLVSLENDDFDLAHAKFIEALRHDPNYKRAQLKAKSIEPIVGLLAGQ